MPFVCLCLVVNQQKTNICTQGTRLFQQRNHMMSTNITVVRLNIMLEFQVIEGKRCPGVIKLDVKLFDLDY